MKCEKITYQTFAEAKSVVNQAQTGRTKNRHRATKKPKRAYKCEDCGKFHLTSETKERKNTNTNINKNKTLKENVTRYEYGKPEHKSKTLNIKTNEQTKRYNIKHKSIHIYKLY